MFLKSHLNVYIDDDDFSHIISCYCVCVWCVCAHIGWLLGFVTRQLPVLIKGGEEIATIFCCCWLLVCVCLFYFSNWVVLTWWTETMKFINDDNNNNNIYEFFFLVQNLLFMYLCNLRFRKINKKYLYIFFHKIN